MSSSYLQITLHSLHVFSMPWGGFTNTPEALSALQNKTHHYHSLHMLNLNTSSSPAKLTGQMGLKTSLYLPVDAVLGMRQAPGPCKHRDSVKSPPKQVGSGQVFVRQGGKFARQPALPPTWLPVSPPRWPSLIFLMNH